MATPFSEIYDLYFGMCTDYMFLQLPKTTQDEILEGWLLSAVAEFDNCKKDLLDRDDTLKQFNVDLSDAEKNILAKFILSYWLSPKLYTLDNLQNRMHPKDFNMFSPANLLKELRELHNKTLKEAHGAKLAYSYRNFNPLTDLRD